VHAATILELPELVHHDPAISLSLSESLSVCLYLYLFLALALFLSDALAMARTHSLRVAAHTKFSKLKTSHSESGCIRVTDDAQHPDGPGLQLEKRCIFASKQLFCNRWPRSRSASMRTPLSTASALPLVLSITFMVCIANGTIGHPCKIRWVATRPRAWRRRTLPLAGLMSR
jgi:hypothetical protein